MEIDKKPANGQYILAYVNDETISPQGNGKSYGYALGLLKEYQERVPEQNWQMFRLLPVVVCLQCSHNWTPKKGTRPKLCPHCQSDNWDHSRDARRDYNFGEIEVGQTVIYPWFDDAEKNHLILRALNNYQKRTKAKFKHQGQTRGLQVTRIA